MPSKKEKILKYKIFKTGKNWEILSRYIVNQYDGRDVDIIASYIAYVEIPLGIERATTFRSFDMMFYKIMQFALLKEFLIPLYSVVHPSQRRIVSEVIRTLNPLYKYHLFFAKQKLREAFNWKIKEYVKKHDSLIQTLTRKTDVPIIKGKTKELPIFKDRYYKAARKYLNPDKEGNLLSAAYFSDKVDLDKIKRSAI